MGEGTTPISTCSSPYGFENNIYVHFEEYIDGLLLQVLATNSDYLIPISLQLYGKTFGISNLDCLISHHSGCNNIWITQSEFVAITQFFFVFGTNNLCEPAVQVLKDLP